MDLQRTETSFWRIVWVICMLCCMSNMGIGQSSSRSTALSNVDRDKIQSPNLRFEHVSLEDGISDIRVTAILQDSKGFMWFGTHNGLNRYDGYTYTVYEHDPLDSTSLVGNRIEALYEDHLGNIWIGTNTLCRYNWESDDFTQFHHDPDESTSISTGGVASIHEGSDGYLWLGMWSGGLNRYNPETGRFKRFAHDPKNSTSLTDGSVTSIYEDKQGNLWIGSGFYSNNSSGGLNLYDPVAENFSTFTPKPNDPNSLKEPVVLTTFEDSRGDFWVGTLGDGLYLMDRDKGSFTHFPYDPSNKHQLSGPNIEHGVSSVISIDEDPLGRLWIAGIGGLVIFDPETEYAHRYQTEQDNPNSLGQDFPYRMAQDRSGNFWLGDGTTAFLDKVSLSPALFQEFGNGLESKGAFKGNNVSDLAITEEQDLWIATERGINRIDPVKQTLTSFIPSSSFSFKFFCLDAENTIWYENEGSSLGRYDPAQDRVLDISDVFSAKHKPDRFIGGLYYLNPDKLWVSYHNDSLFQYDIKKGELLSSFDLSSISCVFKDQSGRFWVGSYWQGLFLYDSKSNQLENVLGIPIYSLHEDQKGNFWIGTNGNGLWKYDPETGQKESFTTKDGLAANDVFEIAEDHQGNLWLATSKKISKFNPPQKSFRNFGAQDGIFNLFSTNTTQLTTPDGTIYFGGTAGLTKILPSGSKTIENSPEIRLLQLQTPIDTFSLLQHKGEQLELSYQQNTLLFEYVGFHYRNPSKNAYQFILENEDENWVEAGTERKARYTKLSPGNYRFRVKVASSEGLWSEEAVLNISIHAPWWQTIWAYIAYAFLLLASIYAVVQWRTYSLRRQRELLRTRVAEQTQELLIAKQQAESANEAKSTFLSTVSHELRTPLTSIIGFTQLNKKNLEAKVIPKIDPEDPKAQKAAQRISSNLDVVSSEGERLTSLINELLDLAKIESGQIEWKRETFRAAALIERAQNATAALFVQKPSLKLITALPNDLPEITGDPDRLLQVLINLISNAVKFTDAGHVTVGSDCNPNLQNSNIVFYVTDTGSGIPSDQLDKVFERFQQVEDNQTGKPKGTGLGLPICKEIVEHHGGQIWAESEVGQGSTFSFSIALNSQQS